ncbi:MAG: CBS domain-containing protein [Nitrococcus sp.]|nr:CBS domain-containing protein [Nitrococcus sp.]
MRHEFAALSHIHLQPGKTFEHPTEPPDFVHWNSPAVEVMTDFRIVHPITIPPDVSIDTALEKMKQAGVRLLLVVNEQQVIIGVITARDIQGERPVKLVQETRIPHSAIHADAIMTPQPEIIGLNMISVRNAVVGHIVETLRQLERQHVLVLEIDDVTKSQTVRGLFSTSQIRRQLGEKVLADIVPAHSLAEMQHEIR